ncbi:hypothetical protein BKA63DRAFT_281423 [Paraphoma chrysanthemicola]|nr:hypothetical protein BKA63DRAFT_281423 [Paraphoma chrysanthemicola]
MDGERSRTIRNAARQLSSWSPRKPHLQPGGTISKLTKCRMNYTISEDATKASGALCKMKFAALQARASHGPNTTKVAGASASSTERQSRQKPNSQNSSLNFDSSSTMLSPPLFPANGSIFQQIGTTRRGFKCDYPGCRAPPFHTQYLLNSHTTNVHPQHRPHYCSVTGCPRSEGGKGFKRKNEMIRHGLVHQSPGYACPFCPDRENKYPGVDNLQRHVQVHHVDKDKDDPQLRDVLAQRPEGGSRGRRKRISD